MTETELALASLAAGFLLELRADPLRAIEGMQLTMAAHQGGGASAQFAKLAMQWSEDPRMAEPDDPAAPAWCDFCGATTDLAEDDDLGTGDVPCTCHHAIMRPCQDTDACIRRREERFPPSMDRVPTWLLTAGSEAAAAAEAASLVRAAAGQAAREYYAELTAAAAEGGEIGLAGQPVSYGSYSLRGDWYPLQPAWNINWAHINWQHTLRNRAHHAHLISGNGLTPARLAAMAKVNQARGARQQQEAAPSGSGGQARREIPPEGIPENVRQALDGDHVGGDVQLQQPQTAAAIPQRPARVPRDRYGNRRYPRRRSR